MTIMSFMLTPVIVDARAMTEEEANKKISSLITEEEDGSCTFVANSVPYEKLKEDACGFTYEEYVEKHAFKDSYTEEQLEEAYELNQSYCESSMFYHAFSHYDEEVSLYYNENFETIDLVTYYGGTEDQYGNLSNATQVERTCNIEYSTYNENTYETAREAENKLDYTYTLYGYDAINSFYHYGYINNDVWNSNNVMYRFPKIKEVFLDYPEFKYGTSLEGGATAFHSNTSGFIKIFKNNTLYAMHYITADYYGLLLVDKDEEGTTLEKAKRALDNYFGEKVEYSFDESYLYDINDSGFDLVNKAFGTTGIDYEGIDVMVTLPSGKFNLGVVEMSKEDIKEFQVTGKDIYTDIHFSTNSYDVPVDATINAEDVTKDVDKIFDKKMYKVYSAYDMKVVKMKDGGFINTIENGIDVYLPISNRKLGEEMTVYHITDNKKGEGFKGVVVEVEGKQYVKFTTTHFSTYALVEEITESVTNPNTADNVLISIICLLLSAFTIGGLVINRKFN